MIEIDSAPVVTPCFEGKDCLRDGEHIDENGNVIDCYCGECKHYLLCFGHTVTDYLKSEHIKKQAEL